MYLCQYTTLSYLVHSQPRVAPQLIDLGFENHRIAETLRKHDNDRDKALEELIT